MSPPDLHLLVIFFLFWANIDVCSSIESWEVDSYVGIIGDFVAVEGRGGVDFVAVGKMIQSAKSHYCLEESP
jgi:hypothetical protein